MVDTPQGTETEKSSGKEELPRLTKTEQGTVFFKRQFLAAKDAAYQKAKRIGDFLNTINSKEEQTEFDTLAKQLDSLADTAAAELGIPVGDALKVPIDDKSNNPEEQKSQKTEELSYKDPHTVYEEAVAKLQSNELTPEQMFQKLKQEAEEQKKKIQKLPKKPERKFSSIDKVRHKTLLLEAKARGVTDLDGFQKLVEYFETTLTEEQRGPEVFVRSNITDDEKKALFQKWEAKGYENICISNLGKQHYLRMEKNISLNLRREHIPVLQKLLSLHPNPIEIIQTMREAGMYFSDHDINPRYQTGPFRTTATEYLGELMQSPHVDEAMKIIKGIKWGRNCVWNIEPNYDEPKPIETLLSLLHDEQAIAQFTPDVIEKINILFRNVFPSELKQYIALINDPDQFNCLVAMRYNSQGLFPGSGSIFNRLNALREANLLQPLTDLNTYGVDIDKYLYSYSSDRETKMPETDADAIAQLQELIATGAMQDFLGDAEKREFVRLIADISFGQKLSVKNIERNLADFDNREKLFYLRRLVYGENNAGNIDIPRRILERRYIFLSPEFATFLNELKSNGYESVERDFFDPNRYPFAEYRHQAGSALNDAYYLKDTAEKLYENSSTALIAAIHDKEKMDFLQRVAESPFLADALTLLREYHVFANDFVPQLQEIMGIACMRLAQKEFVDTVPVENRQQWLTVIVSLPEYAQNTIGSQAQKEGGFSESILQRATDIREVYKQIDASAYSSDALKRAVAYFDGNVHNLFKDGQPTHDLANLLIRNKNFDLFYDVLSSENVLVGYDEQTQQALSVWKDFPDRLRNLVAITLPDFPTLSLEDRRKLNSVQEIVGVIDASPSREMHKLRDELLLQLWALNDPTYSLEQVRQVFEHNNLPIVGKIFRVFEILQGTKTPDGTTPFETTLQFSRNVSPELKAAKNNAERFAIVYKDLLRMHVESDNPSMRHYMQVLEQGESLIAAFESAGDTKALSSDQQVRLTYFLDKMDTLYVNSLFGRTLEERKKTRNPTAYTLPLTATLPVAQRISQLRKNFRVGVDQKFTDRLAQMYAKPLGLRSLEDVSIHMKQVKRSADVRNKLEAEDAIAKNEGKLNVSSGDLLKGTPIQYLSQQLENGFGCPEVLGADSKSDTTPYDTDLGIVLEEDISNGIASAFLASPAKEGVYGEIVLLIRDRGQFVGDNKYELFKTGFVDERHYGIRTGFASTEIDAILLKSTFEKTNLVDKLYLAIAQNEFYIPVANTEGTIIFTPEMYDEYRKTFAGIEEFNGEGLEVRRMSTQEGDYKEIKKLVAGIKDDEKNVDRLSQDIRTIINEVLLESGIRLRDPYDTSLYGADLLDTGSTGRHTNTPGDHDFDWMLLLDARDVSKMQEVATKIKERLHPKQDKSHIESDYVQVRAIGSSAVSGKEVLDIDIGLGKRSDYSVFASHNAIAAKLNWIRAHNGEDAYREVLANIVLAKRVLKEGHAYKKGDIGDGGFGGIGTENWVLANGGNFLKACESFYEASHKDGAVLSFEEFKARYKLFDAGVNLKFGNHDNFTKILEPKGYGAMVTAIENYLAK